MTYKARKDAAIYRPTKPTMTDQSQASDTDVNVIVRKYAVSGTVPGHQGQPLYGDFTQMPRDLRELIQRARSIERLRGELPKTMQSLTLQDLVDMDNEALISYIQPAAQPATKEETK